jgi:3-deoxy-D-manno-octulosonic-acid transferase
MVAMALYSLLLMAVLVIGAPYWLVRMVFSPKDRGRYRAGLRQRLGAVPVALRAAVAGRQVVWVHAVSVGEVLAATRLVAELEAALTAKWGDGWVMVVSTTTATGQALARQRFGSDRVFYYPLDFAWAVRAYLRALKPKLLVLMESELWPRMLAECGRAGIPVAVANARVSDRSFARGMRVKAIWGRLLRRVDLFLAQSEEDARRLVAMGARESGVKAIGNLKYDVRAAGENQMKKRIGEMLYKTRLVVAGSTLEGEEKALLAVWPELRKAAPDAVLLIAPRHPDRFASVVGLAQECGIGICRCSHLLINTQPVFGGAVLLLDTVGDLAAIYSLGSVAFVGGSLVSRGGHNPLEPAQFGVPVVMGPSFENFRDIVAKMQAADAISIVKNRDELAGALLRLLTDHEQARAMGERGRRVFEAQQGATARAVEALAGMVKR